MTVNRIYLKGRVVDEAKYLIEENIFKFTLAVKGNYNSNLNRYLYKLI